MPEQGDWYARSMYIEGNRDYTYEAKHYGPQYAFGFKDIDHAWHAEHWDPERLDGALRPDGGAVLHGAGEPPRQL